MEISIFMKNYFLEVDLTDRELSYSTVSKEDLEI